MADVKDLLNDYERRLRELLPGIDLLGELALAEEDRTHIAQILGTLLRANKPELVTKHLEAVWPVTLAAYLVAEGMASYRGGNFWDGIIVRTGLPHAVVSDWGRIFEQTVRTAGKPTFGEMVHDQHAARYVAPILAHGGIPDYCLDDFFRDVLHRRSRRERWVEGDAENLIAEWRSRRDPLPFADRPVRRFLMFGGAVARDFLDRCLEMARLTAESGAPPAADLGLPERVVARYRGFVARLAPEERRQVAIGGRGAARFVRPYLRFDPWGGGIELVLPEQMLPAEFDGGRLTWSLSTGDAANAVRVALQRRGAGRVSEAETMWLPRPEAVYTVTLLHGEERLRQWEIPGLSARRPLLPFTPATGRQIESSEALPAGLLWLLYPRGHQIQVRHSGASAFTTPQAREELPTLGGGWAGHYALAVELDGCDRLRLGAVSGGDGLEIPVRVPVPAPPRPHLAGTDPVLPESEPGEGALYSGALPDLVVPLVRDDPATLARWQIEVRPAGGAHAARRFHLTGLPHAIGDEPGTRRLPLAALLGDQPIGAFHLLVRGPLGQDASLTLRVVPALRVEGGDRLVLPGDPGGVIVTTDAAGRVAADGDATAVHRLQDVVELGHPPRPQLADGDATAVHRLQGGDDTSQIHPRGGGGDVPAVRQPAGDQNRSTWVVTPAAGAAACSLRYARVARDGTVTQVSFRIPVRRLRWAVLGVELAAGARLVAQALTVDQDAFDEADDPRLVVEASAGDDTPVAIQLLLHDAGGELQESGWERISASGRCLIPLAPFRDTARRSGRPSLALSLRLRAGGGGPVTLPIVRLTQSFTVQDLTVTATSGPPPTITATWQAARMAPHRALLIWSLRRSLEEPRMVLLPDGAESGWTGELSEALPPGRFRAALAVVDPWTGLSDLRLPGPGAANVAELTIPRQASGAGEHLADDDIIERLFGEGAGADAAMAASPDLILPALLDGRIGRVYGAGAAQEARRLCVRDRDALIRAVADLADVLTPEEERRLVRLLQGAGAGGWQSKALQQPHASPDDWWRMWPPLGLFVDVDAALAGDDDAGLRCQHGLRADAVDGGAGTGGEAGDRPAGPSGSHALPAGMHRLFATAAAGSPAGRLLTRWKDSLTGGLLGGAALVQAQYESVTLLDGDDALRRRTSTLISNNLTSLVQCLGRLDRHGAAPRCLVDELNGRLDLERTLPNAPFVVGVAALLQRTLARAPRVLIDLKIAAATTTELGRYAAELAPLLYLRDLCFADLVLAIHAPAAAPALAR